MPQRATWLSLRLKLSQHSINALLWSIPPPSGIGCLATSEMSFIVCLCRFSANVWNKILSIVVSVVWSGLRRVYEEKRRSITFVFVCNGAWWRFGRVDAFHPKGHGFDSRSSRHVGTLGKSFTRSCLGASASNSGTVTVLCRERLWVVVDLKRRYENSLNGWMNELRLRCIHVHTYEHTCMHSNIERIHTHVHIYIDTHVGLHTYMRVYIYIHAHSHTDIQYTRTKTNTQTNANLDVCKHKTQKYIFSFNLQTT